MKTLSMVLIAILGFTTTANASGLTCGIMTDSHLIEWAPYFLGAMLGIGIVARGRSAD